MNLIHNVKLLLVNGTIALGVSMADIETGLKVSLLLVSLGYTVWKWYKDYKKG